MTTNTTVETSHTAMAARPSRAARKAKSGKPYARLNLKLNCLISNCWFGFGVQSTYFWSP